MSTAKRSTARSLPCVLEDSVIHDNQQNGTGIFSSLYATELVGRFKIAVIGDKGCGKTSLLNSFVNRRCEFDVPLLFEEGVSTVRSGTKHVDFVIWDLSGCIEYDGLRYELYKDTDMFLICFDIGDFSTLQNVTENWIPELASYEPNIPFILVGCKHDLRSNSNINNNNNNNNNNKINKNNYYDNNNNNNNNNKNNSNINNINNNNNNNSNNNNNNINNEGSFSSSTNEELKYTVDKETALRVVRDWGGKDYVECCARTGFNVSEVFRVAAHTFISSSESEKSNSKPLKGFSKFAKRKSVEIGEMFQHGTSKNSLASRRGSSYA